MEKMMVVAVALLILLIIASNYISSLSQTIVTHETPSITTPEATTSTTMIVIPTEISTPTTTTYGSAAIKVPAIDDEGNGVVTWLRVNVMPGEGRILVDINQLLFWIDTQYSIQVAEYVAEDVTGINVTNMDFIYSIETNASLIEGPSAGAALTVATVAALENKSVNPNVMITGIVEPDGTIGKVGGIAAKATAAKDVGATLFLVPAGQAVQRYYTPEKSCEYIGPVTYCRTTYKEESVDVSSEVGIDVKEVSNIEEALGYFLV